MLIPIKCATNTETADWMFPIAIGLIMTWPFFFCGGGYTSQHAGS